MEQFKKFCVAYDEGVEQLNNFCSEIRNIIKETQAVDSNFVLVKYIRIGYRDYYYFCPECVKKYEYADCPFNIININLIPEAHCSRCGEEFMCERRYDVITKKEGLNE